MFMGGGFAGQGNKQNDVPVLLTGLTAGPDGGLLYSLETDAVSGIFLRDAAGITQGKRWAYCDPLRRLKVSARRTNWT